MERGEYRPQVHEAALDAGLPGNSREKGTDRGQPFRYFLPTLERRVSEHLTHSNLDSTVLAMSSEIHRIWREAQHDGNEAAKNTTFGLKWAYDTLTFHCYSFFGYQEQLIRDYNTFQAENTKKGDVVKGIDIHEGEEKQTLLWMLDTVGVPLELGTGDIGIPFATLEQHMRYVSAQWAEQANAEPTPIYFDHEIRTGVTDLMEQWQQTEGTIE